MGVARKALDLGEIDEEGGVVAEAVAPGRLAAPPQTQAASLRRASSGALNQKPSRI